MKKRNEYTREQKIQYYRTQVVYHQEKLKFAMRRLELLENPHEEQDWNSDLAKELEQKKNG